jgi:predicted phage tail protein
MRQYRLAATAEAQRLDRAAEVSAERVARSIQRGSNYVLGVVLFAVSLFFAGISTRITAPGQRKALLGLGCLLFVATVVWIATFPVDVEV